MYSNNNVNTNINYNDKICIMGSNGCGKSTLINALVGEKVAAVVNKILQRCDIFANNWFFHCGMLTRGYSVAQRLHLVIHNRFQDVNNIHRNFFLCLWHSTSVHLHIII